MKKNNFERGSVRGGIVRVVIACIGLIVGIIVLSTAVVNWDNSDSMGSIFMLVVSTIIIIGGISFIINGIQMIINGQKSFVVSRKGHSERGKIVDLSINQVTENNNGAVTTYLVYKLKFEYTDDFGNLCESTEQVSKKIYDKLTEMQLVPILVLNERAIFDQKKFEEENFLNN